MSGEPRKCVQINQFHTLCGVLETLSAINRVLLNKYPLFFHNGYSAYPRRFQFSENSPIPLQIDNSFKNEECGLPVKTVVMNFP